MIARFLIAAASCVPVAHALFDALLESRLRVKRFLNTLMHQIPPCVLVFHNFVHLCLIGRPGGIYQATLDILDSL